MEVLGGQVLTAKEKVSRAQKSCDIYRQYDNPTPPRLKFT